MIMLYKLSCIILGLISCFGWGYITRLASGEPCRQKILPFYTSTVGLVLICFLGGILNIFKIAVPIALWILLLVGIIISAMVFFQQKRNIFFQQKTNPIILCFYCLILITLIFLLYTIVPAQVFNLQDDHLCYFEKPVRMLSYGTLSGDPFSAQGLFTLGAQHFLNGFIIIVSNVTFYHGFDAVFCFILLCLLMLDSVKILGLPIKTTIIGCLVLILYNPQQVNISSVYSGALILSGLVLCAARILSSENETSYNTINTIRYLIPLALFTAALAALKNTYIPFLLFFVPCLSLILIKYRGLKALLYYFIFCLVFISPWIIVNWHIFEGVLLSSGSESAGTPYYKGSIQSAFANLFGLFELTSLQYGSTPIAYTSSVLLGIFFMTAVFVKNYHNACKSHLPIFCSALTVSSIYLIYPLLLFTYQTSIRYAIPLLIAVFPLSLILFIGTFSFDKNKAQHRWGFIVLLSAVGIMLIGFVPNLYHRIYIMKSHGTNLAYPLSATVIRYSQIPHQKTESDRVRHLQSFIPVDAALLYWAANSWELNFKRNRVFSPGDGSGITSPALKHHTFSTENFAAEILTQYQIEYVIFEYNGPVVRNEQAYQYLSTLNPKIEYCLKLFRHLKQLAKENHVFYDDGRTIVFKIRE